MDTIENAVQYLQLHKTPYWNIQSGTAKVGESDGTDNLEDSITRFRNSMQLLPAGSYKLLCSKNPKDNRGGLTCPFTKGGNAQTTAPMQTAQLSTNAYGISDTVLQQIQTETRRTLLFEQMHQQFGPMADLVKDLEKRVAKLEKILIDEDEDGTPDFFETAKKASETVQAGSEMMKVFKGGSLFGR